LNPGFEESFEELVRIIRDQEVVNWVVDRIQDRSPETLTYLAKFAYMTGLINKADIKRFLNLDSKEARKLVKGWYDDHRERGCGTC